MKLITCSLSLAALLALGSVANADILMDQITGAVLLPGVNPGADQVFNDFTDFSCVVIDNFTTANGYQLTNTSIVLEGSYNPTGYQVSVWSSLADAASSGNGLNGNAVAQQLVPLANVTTTSLGINSNGLETFRADMPINLALTNPGTYFLGLSPIQDFAGNGQLFIMGASTGNPGGNNAVWLNPGGGFGLGTSVQTTSNAALRLEGRLLQAPVPEPGSVALLVGLATVTGIAVRRRKK